MAGSIEAHWMEAALAEARQGLGLTSPNPPVGAVVVSREGQLLGRGWHRAAGLPHAEVEALRDAARRGHSCKGATLFVTLEPCSTQGRTPPCTSAITEAGLARVVWGVDDPNPKHAGKAKEMLAAAGIAAECSHDLGAAELLWPWKKFITTGLPHVVAKLGMSLDGKITRPPGEGQWITSEASRQDAMRLRAVADAIVVGAETVRQDDPALTIRGDAHRPEKVQPWRVVVTRSGNLPADCKLLTDEFRERTLTMTATPRAILEKLAREREVVGVLVEGGGNLLASMMAQRLVDEFVVYVAPRICGVGKPAIDPAAWSGHSQRLRLIRHEAIGEDLKIVYRPA